MFVAVQYRPCQSEDITSNLKNVSTMRYVF
jgi:hypothetical protein